MNKVFINKLLKLYVTYDNMYIYLTIAATSFLIGFTVGYTVKDLRGLLL